MAEKKKTDGCATCGWSKMVYTSHNPPRIKEEAGRCMWPIAEYMPKLPTSFLLFTMPRANAVWPGDGKDCACWKKVEK